jgi:hypothetical protein
MTDGVVAPLVAEQDTVSENPRGLLCGGQPALLVRGSSVTDHCHAVPTRAYQGDYRRSFLTSTTNRATHPSPLGGTTPGSPRRSPLDKPFHISSPSR